MRRPPTSPDPNLENTPPADILESHDVMDGATVPDQATTPRTTSESRAVGQDSMLPVEDEFPVHVWSLAPDEIERLILEELASTRHGAIWDAEATCTDVQCTIKYTRDRASVGLSLTQFLRSPPINASGVGTRWVENPDGTFTHTQEATTYREPPPDSYRKGFGLTADELVQFGERYSGPDELYAVSDVFPVGQDDEVGFVVENICSTDCPLDLQQVVHFLSLDGRACEETGYGVEQEFLVRAEDGSFSNRTLCVAVPYE